MADDEFWSVKIMTITETASSKNEGSGWGVWLIQYAKGAQSISVKLVAGEYYTKDGEVRYKAKGMGKKDLEACRPYWAQIKEHMERPPALPARGQEPAAPASSGFEEVPF